MIETRVRVVAAADGKAWVTSSEASGCAACQSQSRCGIAGLGQYLSRRRSALSIQQPGACVGDELSVCVDESELLRAGVLAYLMPAALAVAFAVLADAFGTGNPAAAFAALLGLVVGLIAARFLAPAPRIESFPISAISGEPS